MKTINILQCSEDGVQTTKQVEVPDDYFPGTDNSAQISALKVQLSETDYKIIKCSECQLAGLELPYDIAAIHTERQAIRDQINTLESGA